ncbi:hypothetical protein TIFTF001_035954 [Ficus carica]|uniref:Transposase n=1 Tax=Ficus carica TaxID=3494 RepID=A0AA88JAP8_FICCA|nr:hypothetical protein TIFTF001_035954 [Ficus carica]
MSQDNEEELSTQTQIGKPRRTNSPRFNPDEYGQPLGKEGDELQSWIGVLAREHIPIWISNFRSADLARREERVWVEVVTSFTVEPSFKKQALKSCVVSGKNFRYDLYQAFVRDHIDEETVWQRPSKVVHNYPTISQDDWEKFIAYRHGKWAERHTRWLDMRVKPDGEFKNAAFKIIADTIDDFNEQETQRSFESVGKDDILTKALGNVEHSGRIRGQFKTVQELCAKHGINLETMAEETIVPIVGQHNSFKTSCTLNEKEAGPSDPQPMPNAIHGIPFEENVRVTITVPKLKRALLPIPTNEATYIEEAVCGFVAWPKRLVVVQTSLSQASQGPSHAPDQEAEGNKRTKKRARRKKIQSQPEVQQQPVQQELPLFDFSQIPFELRPLAYYAQSSMRDGTQIACPLQQFVIGDDMPIYIGFEDVYHFITFKEIIANSRMVYIRYLADCCARAVIDLWDDSVLYFNPLGNKSGDDFKDLIIIGIRKRRNCETLIGILRCPIQEGYVECGYFVLAFMREITLNVDGLVVLQTKDFYTDVDMSLVRQE